MGDRLSGVVGYKARRHTDVIDVDKVDHYDPREFWEPVYPHRGARGPDGVVLDPNDFYILASREAVVVPPDHAAEMLPYDAFVGEFRVHYAGFFDPGFGSVEADGSGSRAVLEVRSHEVPFLIEHGQVVGRMLYEPLIARPGPAVWRRDRLVVPAPGAGAVEAFQEGGVGLKAPREGARPASPPWFFPATAAGFALGGAGRGGGRRKATAATIESPETRVPTTGGSGPIWVTEAARPNWYRPGPSGTTEADGVSSRWVIPPDGGYVSARYPPASEAPSRYTQASPHSVRWPQVFSVEGGDISVWPMMSRRCTGAVSSIDPWTTERGLAPIAAGRSLPSPNCAACRLK